MQINELYMHTHTRCELFTEEIVEAAIKKKRRKSFLIKSHRRRLSWARQIEDGFLIKCREWEREKCKNAQFMSATKTNKNDLIHNYIQNMTLFRFSGKKCISFEYSTVFFHFFRHIPHSTPYRILSLACLESFCSRVSLPLPKSGREHIAFYFIWRVDKNVCRIM